MDKIKEIRIKFQENELYLYEWISKKSSANSSFIRDILKKEYAKEQVEIYGRCDLIAPPVFGKKLEVVEVTENNQELNLDFEIDDLN